MRPGIPPSVKVVNALLHANYEVDGEGYDTRAHGITTAVLAERFLAGESVLDIACDYAAGIANFTGLSNEIEDALRWEMRPRRWRVKRVREAVKGGR